MADEFGADLMTIVDDEGNRHQFELLDAIETDDGRYVALLPVYDQPEESVQDDGELVILEVVEEDGEELLVILAHGGTQMAAMERYALPRRDYYAWCGPNAGGYVLDAADWAEKRQLRLVKTVQYTKDAEAGV